MQQQIRKLHCVSKTCYPIVTIISQILTDFQKFLWKSVKIWLNYCHNRVAHFLRHSFQSTRQYIKPILMTSTFMAMKTRQILTTFSVPILTKIKWQKNHKKICYTLPLPTRHAVSVNRKSDFQMSRQVYRNIFTFVGYCQMWMHGCTQYVMP